MDDGDAHVGPPRALGDGAGPRGARPLVYLFPCRIQQGWGDVEELALAARALHRSGLPLAYLEPSGTERGKGAGRRHDRRAIPVDPGEAGPVVFPPHRRLQAPFGRGKAIVLATWWGVTARRHDLVGGPLPGPLEGRVGAVVEAHGPRQVLHVSLEEFASDQRSREVLSEGLRQAGWTEERRRRALASPAGRSQKREFHRAFVLARAGERDDVLHLCGSFAPDRASHREFPFLLPILPFGAPPGPSFPRPRRPRSVPRVIWYASPPSSARFARLLYPALAKVGRPVRLEVRAARETGAALSAVARDPAVDLQLLPELPPRSWRARWDGADLRIASGSLSLLESVRRALPFLYFNGISQGEAGEPRGFRREKLLSLLRALEGTRGSSGFAADLVSFADGEGLAPVLERALSATGRWQRSAELALRSLTAHAARSSLDGDRFLVQVAWDFARDAGPVTTFVPKVRRAYGHLLR